jgi:hypothetical protein
VNTRMLPATPPADRGSRSSIVDTTELRWFVAGPLPPDVGRWFAGSMAVVEHRRDDYLLNDRLDVGIKRRGGAILELKVRRRVEPWTDPDEHLAGSLETWRKWTPADGLIEIPPTSRWIAVDKRIMRRRFSADGREVAFASEQRGDPACDVEVAEIAVGGVAAWTFALAAFGLPACRCENMLTLSRALRAHGRPTSVRFDAGQAMGYPEWISNVPAPTLDVRRQLHGGRQGLHLRPSGHETTDARGRR